MQRKLFVIFVTGSVRTMDSVKQHEFLRRKRLKNFCHKSEDNEIMNAKIKRLLPIIHEYFKDKPVVRAWLFGSYSRGEETPESDIDILVDYDRTKGRISLFMMGGMLMELSKLLGNKVDLVDNRGLMQFARESVEHDRILIYERAY